MRVFQGVFRGDGADQDGSAPVAGRVEHAEALLGTQAPQGGDDVHRHVLVSTLC